MARALAILIGGALKMVLTVSHGIAEGLWHVPILYGDPMARKRDVIKDFLLSLASGPKVMKDDCL